MNSANHLHYREVKYRVERLVGISGLLVVLPLLLLIALAVKLTSRGPVFFVSERIGKDGKLFKLYKFRSMDENAPHIVGDDGKLLTLKEDPRLTPIGKVLRLGFDELPQLINVAKGEMCLIGPRPDIPEELERYSQRERKRLDALPGITGLAQVSGGRYMNNAQNYELDVLYVENACFWMDFLILVLTLPYSLGYEGAGKRFFAKYLDVVQPLASCDANSI